MKKLLYWFPLIMLMAVACQSDGPGVRQTETDLRFTIKLPGQTARSVQGGTRAAYGDTDIDNVDLLVFDQNGNFVERVAGSDIAGTGDTRSFTARLRLSPTARTIYIVTNGRDPLTDDDRVNFEIIGPGTLANDAIPYLTAHAASIHPTEEDLLPLIMYGRIALPEVSATQDVPGVKLLRMAAAIEVHTETPSIDNGLVYFNLHSFSITNAASWGRVAPKAWNVTMTTPAEHHASAIPHGRDYFNDEYTGYWAPGTDPVLYMYERGEATLTDYTGVIIRATYNGDEGYYKILLKDGNNVPVDFVRNHRYILTITGAYGAGYPTLQEAIDGRPNNELTVQMIDERDDLTSYIADRTNFLAISNNYVSIVGTYQNEALELAQVYSTSDASVATDFYGLNELALSAPDPVTGLRRITAKTTSTGDGTVTVTDDGGLKLTINVSITDGVSFTGATGTGSYNIIPSFLSSGGTPWRAELGADAHNIFLHTGTAGNTIPAPNSGISWGVSSISSTDPYIPVFPSTPPVSPYPRTLNVFFSKPLNATIRAELPDGTIKFSHKQGAGIIVGRLIFNFGG